MSASDENVKMVGTQHVLRNGLTRAVRFLYLASLSVWALTVYSMILRKTLDHEAFMKAVKGLVFIDFSKFYISGLMAWSADKSKLYDIATQIIWVQKVLGPLDHPADTIPYTPQFCVLMRVLTWMPIERALLVSFIVLFAAALITVTKILLDQGHLTKKECLRFWILAMTPVAVVEIFQLGQNTWLWLAAMATFYGCLLKKRDIVAGIAIAFLAMKPQYAVLTSAAIFGCKRWKILIAAIVTEAILLLGATAVIGVDTMVSYPRFVQLVARHITSFVPNHDPTLGMITLRGLLAPILTEASNYHFCSITNLVVWIPLFFLWHKCSKYGQKALPWVGAITIAATVFFSTHSLLYDFTLISLCWALTLQKGELSWKFEGQNRAKLLWVSMFWIIPGFTWLLSALQVGYEFSARSHAVILLCVMAVAFINLRNCVRDR